MTKFQRRGLVAVGSLLAFLVLLLVGARFGANWYLASGRFRRHVTAAVGHVLKADGTFMPLHYTDGTFYSDGFVARGKSPAFFSELRADQIRALVNWRGLLDHRYEIDELHLQNLDVQFNGPRLPEPPRQPGPQSPKKPSAWKLDLREAEIAQSSWHWGATPAASGSITHGAFTLRPDNGAWLIDASSGTLAQTGWPSLTIESAALRYTGPSLFVTESALRAGEGRLKVNGEINFDHAADFEAQFDHISITPLLPPDWRVRLHGNLAGHARIHATLPSSSPGIEGDLTLADGQLEALPLLDQIATFTRTERFRRIALTNASLSFTRTASGLTTVKNLVLESQGLLRVEGNCTIAGGKIDGRFQLGVTAASLQWLPGSQGRVFTVAHDGYSWTPVHLTGSVEHPHEDLTKRLLAAAAGELLQKSPNDIIDTAKSLLDLIPH